MLVGSVASLRCKFATIAAMSSCEDDELVEVDATLSLDLKITKFIQVTA